MIFLRNPSFVASMIQSARMRFILLLVNNINIKLCSHVNPQIRYLSLTQPKWNNCVPCGSPNPHSKLLVQKAYSPVNSTAWQCARQCAGTVVPAGRKRDGTGGRWWGIAHLFVWIVLSNTEICSWCLATAQTIWQSLDSAQTIGHSSVLQTAALVTSTAD